MANMPVFRSVQPESDTLIDMIQAQEIKLMSVRRDDKWDNYYRRMGSRTKYAGNSDLVLADREKLKVYFIHLIQKEMEIL